MTIDGSTGAIMNLYKQAQSSIPDVISLPPTWLRTYEDFVTKNASAVSQIESGLRSLTYIIPGRFRESELASESLHSSIQLLSLYHTSLLSTPLSRPSPHTRYTKFWTARSPLYARIALLLQTIQYTELLCEMAAKRKGEKMRWRVVVMLEVIKAICRVVLMGVTKSRPLVTPALAERELEPKTKEEDEGQWDGMDEMKGTEEWRMPRTGLKLPKLPEGSEIVDFLGKKVLTADDIKGPQRLLRRVTSNQGRVAEVMWILRPVIYALAMQKWRENRKDWRPWVLGVSIEVGARQLAKRDLRQSVVGGMRGLTALEREELQKRGRGMGWWTIRGAFYENVTKAWIQGVVGSLKGKLLLDMIGGIIEDYEYLWDEYYFSTSTM